MKLTDFCATDDDIRSFLRTPFRCGNYAVASNGHRLAATLDQSELPEPPSSMCDIALKIIDECNGDGFQPLPAFTIPPKSTCTSCDGTGKATVKTCDECDGEGEVEAETDHNIYYGLECKSCDGWGKITKATPDSNATCPTCHGTADVWQKLDHIKVLGLNINPSYLLHIAGDEHLQVKPSENMLLFKNRELCGAIMGMRV